MRNYGDGILWCGRTNCLGAVRELRETRTSSEVPTPAREGRGEADRLAEIAYRTWQRERGVPGDAHWEAMPVGAQAAWRATARAVAEAAAPTVLDGQP